MPAGDLTQEQTVDERHSSVLMDVSNAMVRLHKEFFGRGPTTARTGWAGPDTLLCVLEETLTPAERNLVKLGQHQRLRDIRMFFQHATVREFCDAVERITGRKVKGFTSAIDTEADGLVTECFVLHPPEYDGPSRTDLASLAQD